MTPRSTTPLPLFGTVLDPGACTRSSPPGARNRGETPSSYATRAPLGGVDGPLYQAKLAEIEAAAKAGADAIRAATLTDPARNAARNAYCQGHA